MSNELVLDFGNVKITDNWTGWWLNYLVAQTHPNFGKEYNIPNNVDWKRNLAHGVYLEADAPVDLDFIWAYKCWKLYVDPESEDLNPLTNPETIVVGKWDYQSFDSLKPEQQNLILYCYYRENDNSDPVLRQYHILRDALKKSGARESRARGRRKSAIDYINQRSKEIDALVDRIFAEQGATAAEGLGLQQLNLTNGIKQFFDRLGNEMYVYTESGSLKIVDAISTIMSQTEPDPEIAWLKKNIPIDANPDGSLVLVKAGDAIAINLSNGVKPVAQAQIDAKFAADFDVL